MSEGFHIADPTQAWGDKKTGKLILAIKRIEYQEDNLYYIFEHYPENAEDPEDAEETFNHVKGMAGMLGIPLYDVKEIGEQLDIQMTVEIEKNGVWKGQKDFDLKLHDATSGSIHTVTKGITLGEYHVEAGDNQGTQ